MPRVNRSRRHRSGRRRSGRVRLRRLLPIMEMEMKKEMLKTTLLPQTMSTCIS